MVVKCNGREALVLLTEHDHGFHKEYTAEDIAYLKSRAATFFVYLRKQGLSKEEATEIFKGIREDTIYEITHDWQDEFHIGRERNEALSGDSDDVPFEIDPIAASTSKPQAVLFDEEFTMEDTQVKRIEELAEKHERRNPDSYWSAAKRLMEPIETLLQKLEEKYPDCCAIEMRDIKILKQLTFQLRRLRGLYKPWEETRTKIVNGKRVRTQELRSVNQDGIWISSKMWKIAMNRVNRLLGEKKRYTVDIKEETTEEITEVKGVVVWGLDVEKFPADEETDPDSEEKGQD